MKIRMLFALALALLAGCASGPGAPAPREVALGVDACEYCHMSIDDPYRAAQWVRSDGHVHKFDEPGCLLAWLQRSPDAAGAAFVADEEGSGWVPAESARFLRGAVRTDMGFDVLAFRSAQAAAGRAAGSGGAVLDWETIRREGVEDAHAR